MMMMSFPWSMTPLGNPSHWIWQQCTQSTCAYHLAKRYINQMIDEIFGVPQPLKVVFLRTVLLPRFSLSQLAGRHCLLLNFDLHSRVDPLCDGCFSCSTLHFVLRCSPSIYIFFTSPYTLATTRFLYWLCFMGKVHAPAVLPWHFVMFLFLAEDYETG